MIRRQSSRLAATSAHQQCVDSIGTLEELDALESLIAQRRAKILAKKIQAHVKATEGAYARVATMYDGEYAQLDDQVHARVV